MLIGLLFMWVGVSFLLPSTYFVLIMTRGGYFLFIVYWSPKCLPDQDSLFFLILLRMFLWQDAPLAVLELCRPVPPGFPRQVLGLVCQKISMLLEWWSSSVLRTGDLVFSASCFLESHLTIFSVLGYPVPFFSLTSLWRCSRELFVELSCGLYIYPPQYFFVKFFPYHPPPSLFWSAVCVSEQTILNYMFEITSNSYGSAIV